MADELNLLVQVVMDLMERVKHLERGIVKTPRPIASDLEDPPVMPRPAIGAVNKLVTREIQDKMIELFRAEVPIPTIAERMGWAKQTVHNQLRKAGVLAPAQKRGRLTPKTEDQ